MGSVGRGYGPHRCGDRRYLSPRLTPIEGMYRPAAPRQPGETYRRIRIESNFGRIAVLVTDGHLPYPYGREMMGYEVANLSETLNKATAAGVSVLVPPYPAGDREAAILQFPGGYIAEIHSALSH